ncbi:MAG TPA: hypothetical protein HPP56_01455 [Nitrospirae bacterium]|nr:hypothetical protein [Nitrospirota bacterium]
MQCLLLKFLKNFFYKVSYKIFHQPFLLDFIKFSVLSLILGMSDDIFHCFFDIIDLCKTV